MNHLTVQQLSAALDGALNGPSLELVVHHLAHCHECRDRQARLARNDDVMRRLLAQDPHDFFLDDLERRVEAVVVAILQGLPVPPMVTSSPLQAEEDPFQPVEPPLPERPELGRAGAIAQEAGFGRIGLKPTGSTQPPTSDPAEAQKLLEAMERGDTRDFTEPTAQGMRENAPLDGPVFDLPGWIKQGGSSRPEDPKPREVPKVQLFLDRLGDPGENAPAPRAAERPTRPDSGPWPKPPKLPTADERRFMPSVPAPPETPAAPRANATAGDPPPSPSVATGPSPTPPPSTPASAPAPASAAASPPAAPPPRVEKPIVVVHESPWRKSSAAIPRPVLPPALAKVTAARRPAAPDVVVHETPWRKSSAAIPRPVLSPERLKAFQASAAPKSSAPVPEPPARETPASAPAADLPPRFVKPVTEAYEQVSGPPRRKVPRVRRTQRIAGAWVLATASVGGLLVLVLALQFLPPADTPGATAWRGFQWPQLQFAPGDSTQHDVSPEPGAVVRTATTPFPVDAPVPSLEDSLSTPFTDSTGTVQDSSAATPDSLGAVPGH